MKEIKQTIAMGLLMAAFWGILYPKFSLTQDIFVCGEADYDPDEAFLGMLEGGRENIVFKSKLWELWSNMDQKDDESK